MHKIVLMLLTHNYALTSFIHLPVIVLSVILILEHTLHRHRSPTVNRQIYVGDSKYVIVFEYLRCLYMNRSRGTALAQCQIFH